MLTNQSAPNTNRKLKEMQMKEHTLEGKFVRFAEWAWKVESE